MSEQYTFAVSKIRALEPKLLTKAQLEQVLSADGVAETRDMLESLGIELRPTPDLAFKQRKREVYDELLRLAPDCDELKIFTVKNDIHTIKAALKCLAGGQSRPENFYLYPTSLETDRLFSAFLEEKFYQLPEGYEKIAFRGYELITKTQDGQLLECFLDKIALELMKDRANKSQSPMVKAYVELFIKLCDVKTAFRFSRTGKNFDFIISALCGTYELDAGALAKAAEKGTDELLALLSGSELSKGVELLALDPSAFDRWGDNRLMEIVKEAGLEAFGVDPIFAYYLANEAEIKSLKTLLMCKKIGLDAEKTKERLCDLYV